MVGGSLVWYVVACVGGGLGWLEQHSDLCFLVENWVEIGERKKIYMDKEKNIKANVGVYLLKQQHISFLD